MADRKYNTIKIERSHNGITWLILNRPEKRNAMSPEMHFEMRDALEALTEDEATKVLVLTGAGKSFCAGQDLGLFFRDNDARPRERRRAGQASHSWRWKLLVDFPNRINYAFRVIRGN